MKFRKSGRRTRRGLAGIVATIIMFAILFTVGTSYFIFINATNNQYVHNLVAASNNLQSVSAETLQITTIAMSNGNVGFYANNTSGESVNMTVVYVVSATGQILRCDGVGLPGSAGCSNTVPPLWMVVNVGKGTAKVDTGYLYVAGTTDIVKVISARGNTYSATYPPTTANNAVFANTAQSLTVNPASFKWTTIQPSSASRVQSNYLANCNAAACGLQFGSAVTAGNTLVYGLGWYNQNPPSTPTDTVGTTFTLGTSNSVVNTITPALVQNRYTSNCNSANCGLAYNSNVASGDVLVFGLGWYNQNAPSTPTDTRSDTFVLGASQSVTYNPPAASLVQKNYAANCNAAACGLAFSSSVTAGNTLVYGLGWSAGIQYYVPVTLTNNAGTAPSVDGSNSNECDSSTSCTLSITTANSNDVIYVSVTDSAGGNLISSVSDSAGLTWTQRANQCTNCAYDVYTYYAIASSPLSSDTFTAQITSSANIRLMGIGVSGANTASPFDPNLSSAPTNGGSSSSTTVTVTTTNANDLIIGTTKSASTTVSSGASGYTTIICCTSQYAAFEYKVVSSTGSYTPTFSLSGSGAWGEIGDAIQGTAGSATPSTFQELVTWNPSTYSSYEASDLGNIRFCADSACATTLNGWLESCTSSCAPSATSASAWVKLTSSIAAGGNLTIYMVFYGTLVDFDGNLWGEAPSLSGSYGQFDNGGNVFGKYWNFAGTSLPAGWSKTTGSPANNGLTISAGAVYTTATQFASLNNVLESYFRLTSSTATQYQGMSQSNSNHPAGSNGGSNAEILYISNQNTNNNMLAFSATGGSASYNIQSGVTVFTPTTNTWYILSSWVSSTQAGEQSNYGTAVTGSGTFNTNQYIVLGYFTGSNAGTTSITPGQYQWVRVRALAPNNVMPSTSFGSVSSGNIPPAAPTDTLGNSYTTAVTKQVASGTTTYFSYIWYAVAASSGGNTVTATFAQTVAGTISIYELSGYSTSGVLTSTGSNSGSTSAIVGSFTPNSNSFVIGHVETASSSTTYTVGPGYTLVKTGSGGCDSSDASAGCSEYQAGLGTATTVPFTLSASTAWAESAVSFTPAGSTTYYSYIWYTTAGSNGADTITAVFSQSVTGSVSIYEFSGLKTTGVLSGTGSSSSSSGSSSVSNITPSSGSVVVGNAEANSITYTAGTSYTLSGSCSSVYGCGEYQLGVGSATTVPMSLNPATPWAEVALAFAPQQVTYYSYIWWGAAGGSGTDTISATFSQAVTGSVAVYELTGYATSGIKTSTGSSAGGSTSVVVTSFTPGTNSIVIGDAETSSSSFSAGTGFTNVATCNSVYGCSEYQTGVSAATTVPMTLNPSAAWVETAIAFPAGPVQQSGYQVGGFPSSAIPYGTYIGWRVNFTNQDSQGRSVTLWPKSLAAIESIIQETVEITPWFIVDGVSTDGSSLIAYNSTKNMVTIPYKSTVTVYFGATTPKGTGTDRVDTANEIAPFTGFFALEGIYSDKTLFGLTVPYPAGEVTQSNAATAPLAGVTGTTVTVSCTSPCYFSANSIAYVGWMDSTGHLTTLTKFTMTGSGNIPANITFQVPSASPGYYTVVVSDYINTVYIAFHHT